MTTSSLPIGQSFSKAEIAANFRWYGESNREWARVRFLVPLGWSASPSKPLPEEPGTQDLTTLCLFRPPEDKIDFHIQVQKLEREITAEFILRYALIKAELEPETLKTLSIRFADSLSTGNFGHGSLHKRIAVFIHGDLLYLVSATCPSSGYAELAETFGLFIASFKPASAERVSTIEHRKTAKLDKVLVFEYPASWLTRIVPALKGKQAVDLLASNFGQPTGLLRVKTCSRSLPTQFEMQLEDTLEEFAMAGITVGELQVNQGVKLATPRFSAGSLRVFEASTSTDVPQELWIITLADAADFITVSLLTPDRRTEFLVWAWNRTALDIVTASLV